MTNFIIFLKINDEEVRSNYYKLWIAKEMQFLIMCVTNDKNTKKRSYSYPTPIESKNIKMSEDFGEGELFYQHYVARQDSYNELQKLIEKEEKKLSSSTVPTKDEKKKKEDSVKKVDPLSGSTLLFAKFSILISIHH